MWPFTRKKAPRRIAVPPDYELRVREAFDAIDDCIGQDRGTRAAKHHAWRIIQEFAPEIQGGVWTYYTPNSISSYIEQGDDDKKGRR